MKLFIDTANVEHIREMADLGIISGVTTNPSLIAKEGRDFLEVIKEITSLVDGPISGEVISLDAEGMVNEGIEIAKIHKNMIVKIPMTEQGIKATKKLTRLGIKTNVTLVFSVNQALLAATAGSASIRTVKQLADSALVGAHVATVPYAVLKKAFTHPLTDSGIKAFMDDWKNAFGE